VRRGRGGGRLIREGRHQTPVSSQKFGVSRVPIHDLRRVFANQFPGGWPRALRMRNGHRAVEPYDRVPRGHLPRPERRRAAGGSPVADRTGGMRTLDVVQPLLNVTALHISLIADPTRVIPEVGMGGFNPSPDEARLRADPSWPDLEGVLRSELLLQLAHEVHHAMRRWAIGYGSTLLEAVVTEGLADHFSLEASGGTSPATLGARPDTRGARSVDTGSGVACYRKLRSRRMVRRYQPLHPALDGIRGRLRAGSSILESGLHEARLGAGWRAGGVLRALRSLSHGHPVTKFRSGARSVPKNRRSVACEAGRVEMLTPNIKTALTRTPASAGSRPRKYGVP